MNAALYVAAQRERRTFDEFSSLVLDNPSQGIPFVVLVY